MPYQPCFLFCQAIDAYWLLFPRFKKGTTHFLLIQAINPTFLLVPYLKIEKQAASRIVLPLRLTTGYILWLACLVFSLPDDWHISAAFCAIQKGHHPFSSVSGNKSDFSACALLKPAKQAPSICVLLFWLTTGYKLCLASRVSSFARRLTHISCFLHDSKRAPPVPFRFMIFLQHFSRLLVE